MKRANKKPSLDDVSSVIHGVNLSPLNNRLVGKSLIEFEHCLIELLGTLMAERGAIDELVEEIAQNCYESKTFKGFMDAYHRHERARGDFLAKFASYSPIGRYFRSLQDRLIETEHRQIRDDKANAEVEHARILAAMIVRFMELMTDHGMKRNLNLDCYYRDWMSKYDADLR